jgi:hypothetical protein
MPAITRSPVCRRRLLTPAKRRRNRLSIDACHVSSRFPIRLSRRQPRSRAAKFLIALRSLRVEMKRPFFSGAGGGVTGFGAMGSKPEPWNSNTR